MTSRELLGKAQRALASAELLPGNGDIEGACNRAYYAMFDAACAGLLSLDSGTALTAFELRILPFAPSLSKGERQNPYHMKVKPFMVRQAHHERLNLMAVGIALGKSHSGVIFVFSRHFVKPGRIPVTLGKAFNRAADLRLLADYTGDAIDEETAKKMVQEAGEFLDAMKTWRQESKKEVE